MLTTPGIFLLPTGHAVSSSCLMFPEHPSCPCLNIDFRKAAMWFLSPAVS